MVPPSNADTPSPAHDRTLHDAILDALATKNEKQKVDKLTHALLWWQESRSSREVPQLLVHILNHPYDLAPFDSKALNESDHPNFIALEKVCGVLNFTLCVAPIKRHVIDVWVERSHMQAAMHSIHYDAWMLGCCSEVGAGGGQKHAEGIPLRDKEIVQKDVWSKRTSKIEAEWVELPPQ